MTEAERVAGTDPEPMGPAARKGRSAPAGPRAGGPWPVVAVAFVSALAAGLGGRLFSGNLGWAVIGGAALVGAAGTLVAMKIAQGARDIALWQELADFREEKKTRLAGLTGSERARLSADAATASEPVVGRLPVGESELVGEGSGHPAASRPAGSGAVDPRARAETLRGIDALIAGLEGLSRNLRQGGSPDEEGASSVAQIRTPGQLVDALVLTAADGIEDLAAGLMRANELAAVAERVTNRATLLALNAALEATRSGSEAFAAIAEETRRLAEFAREATDTISRLADEIEYKVGETITAIHSTSEDAKAALASFSVAGPSTAPAPPDTGRWGSAVDALLEEARRVRRSLVASRLPAGSDSAPDPPADSPAGPRADETPSEHMLLLDRLKPAPGRAGRTRST